MIKTRGLTHLALAVRDPNRSFRFYQRLLGVRAVYRRADFIQAQTPGSWDVLVFQKKASRAGKTGGVAHFGFRLQDPGDIDAASREVKRAGGKILSQGEFCPGEPYLFARDPDGYEVEIWYELPTPVDPKLPKSSRSRAKSRGSSVAAAGSGGLGYPGTRRRG